MAFFNRSTRKILAKVISVGIAIALVIILIETLESRQETVSSVQGPGEMKGDFLHAMTWIQAPNKLRVDKAKSFSYRGRHWKYLSEALVDLLGFSSKCQEVGPDDRKDVRRSVSVLIILHSSPSQKALRGKIRETWANPEERQKLGVLVRFVMGGPESQIEEKLLQEESEAHGDILVGNFTDTVRATTLKSLLGLRWTFAFCSRIKYIIEARDNTFIWLEKLPKVLQIFKKEKHSQFILGARSNISRVDHNSPSEFYVGSAVLNREYYPPYCSLQAGIVIPFDLAISYYKYTWSTPSLVPFADALIGLTAEAYGWEVRHSNAFSLNHIEPNDACPISSRFTAISPSFYNIPKIWEELKDKTFMKECEDPDMDIIYAGKSANNAKYFETVLRTVKQSSDVTCTDPDVFMLVLIASHPARKTSRDAIRQTWANKGFLSSLSRKVKVLFLIGQPYPPDPALRLSLDEEHGQNGDLLEGNFLDTFKNLTLKHMFGLTWTAKHCNNAKYFLKGDDDVFANLRNILHLLQEMNSHGKGLQELYLGDGGREYRNKNQDKKYHVASEEYSGRVFPQYCVGGGYVLSVDLIDRLLKESLRTPLVSSRDDVFVGILLRRLDVPLIYNDGFHYKMGPTDTCSLRNKEFMVMHVHDDVEKLVKIWLNFVNPNAVC
ncbi:uncharacterized protein LOC121416580 [Lytechinus variegatus]|uniref:uncharacterized protein LOC121416580 n=1 Tax=Lytechinus variegatus TaxID=7654 RepID=UPI001BB1A63E|nr:uncharacterized protein LOC121416580 [Lytechinus variegatus]